MAATTFPTGKNQTNVRLPGFLRDVRVIAIIAQILFVVLFIGFITFIGVNVTRSLAAQGLAPTFGFMSGRSGFAISDAPLWYSSDSTYADAYLVGIINTLRVVLPGLFLATLIGIFLGIALLSRNFMVRTVSATYVEILRNTPLLVQLFFWYFVVMFSLPATDVTLPNEGILVLPLRVLAYPVLLVVLVVAAWRRGLPHHTFTGVFIGILLAELGMAALGRADVLPLALGVVGAAVGFAAVQGALPAAYRGYGLGIGLALAAQGAGALAVLGMVGAGLLPAAATVSEIYPALFITRKGFVFPEIRFDGGFAIVLPEKPRFQFISGATYTPELMALLVGLVIYTSAFIGEIVRAGIQAVPYGQIEASRALGFSGWQTLRLIVLPQALRVIIPPLSNQYLNLAKNSTLATAVAFSDAYSVGQTIMNQSGQSVTGFFIILITYLTMSLIIATIMNIVNRRFQLVTR